MVQRKGKKGWHGNSRLHGLASKGISTKSQPSIKVNEDSGVWFESDGLGVTELLSLVKLIDFDAFSLKGEAKGYSAKGYEYDSQRIIIKPVSKVKKSIKSLESEYDEGNYARKKQLRGLVTVTIKDIERNIYREKDVDERLKLHESRALYLNWLRSRNNGKR